MHSDVATIYEQQKAIGYPSEFVEGSADSMAYMRGIFDDWQAKGITSVLHEKKGGYSNNMKCMQGLAAKAESEEVTILGNVEVTGVQFSGNSISAVETNSGTIQTDYVVVGAGPWVNTFWKMINLPSRIKLKDGDTVHKDVQMWRYYCLQEGTLGVDPKMLTTNDGDMPPVIHVDTDAPLYSDIDGRLITDKMWGIYYKPDFSFDGVQGGAAPFDVDGTDDNFSVDPYGTESPDCGLGALSPDSFPVFDVYLENCYIIADSNHGYKMLGVGKLVAEEVMGNSSKLMEPFRFSRFEEGKLHPVSNSPFPWS